jgi:hypothetical protein
MSGATNRKGSKGESLSPDGQGDARHSRRLLTTQDMVCLPGPKRDSLPFEERLLKLIKLSQTYHV